MTRMQAGIWRFSTLSPLWRFAAIALMALVVLTLLWVPLAHKLAYPAALLTQWALETGAPGWVRSVEALPGAPLVLDSSVAISSAQTHWRMAEVVLDVQPGRYAYGLPIFAALMLASAALERSPARLGRLLLGSALLWPAQAFSLSFALLAQLLRVVELDARLLKTTQGQVEAIIYGYQLGALVLPTLVPVLLWLWLERRFVQTMLIQAWQASLAPPVAPAPTPQPPVAAAPIMRPLPDRSAPEISTDAAATLPSRRRHPLEHL